MTPSSHSCTMLVTRSEKHHRLVELRCSLRVLTRCRLQAYFGVSIPHGVAGTFQTTDRTKSNCPQGNTACDFAALRCDTYGAKGLYEFRREGMRRSILSCRRLLCGAP